MTNFDMKFKVTKYVEQKLDCLDKFCFELESINVGEQILGANCYQSIIDDAYSRIIGALDISYTLEIISLEEYNKYVKDVIQKHKKAIKCIQ